MTAAILDTLLVSVIISLQYQKYRLTDQAASEAYDKLRSIIKVTPSILKTNQLLMYFNHYQINQHMMASRKFLPSRFRAPMWGWGLWIRGTMFRLIVTVLTFALGSTVQTRLQDQITVSDICYLKLENLKNLLQLCLMLWGSSIHTRLLGMAFSGSLSQKRVQRRTMNSGYELMTWRIVSI